MSADNRSESGLSSAAWAALQQGQRFVLRHRLGHSESHSLTDVVGDVVSVSENSVSVRTRRRGIVQVRRESVIAIKPIPGTPGRRGQPHRSLSIDDLERLGFDSWRPSEHSTLGSWTLRAAGGYTGRANSALVVGQPDRPVAAALTVVESWYRERALEPLLHVPLAPGVHPDADPLVAEAAAHGWEWFQLTNCLTAAASDCRELATRHADVVEGTSTREVTPSRGISLVRASEITEPWWSLADDRMLARPEAARQVLTQSAEQAFFTVFVGGTPAARARVAVTKGWVGLYALATHHDFRRRGLAEMLVGATARYALERDAASMHLQVSADNTNAVSLYERLGFTRHHQYVYLRKTTH